MQEIGLLSWFNPMATDATVNEKGGFKALRGAAPKIYELGVDVIAQVVSNTSARDGSRGVFGMRLNNAAIVGLLVVLTATELRCQQVYSVSNGSQLSATVPLLQAGDTVELLPGIHALSFLNLNGLSGTPKAWVTFRSAGPGRATILATNPSKNVVDIRNCHFIRFEDLELTHAGSTLSVDIIKLHGGTQNSYIILDNCWMHSVPGNGISSQADLTDHLQVLGCEISDVGSSGIYLGFSNPLHLANHAKIVGSYIHDVGFGGQPYEYGIQIKGGSHSAIIEDNVLHDLGSPLGAGIATYYTDFAGNTPPDRWHRIRRNALWNVGNEGIYAANGAVIENNQIIDADRGIAVGSYAGSVINNISVRHNTVYRCPNKGIQLSSLGGAQPSVFVTNNAIFMTNGNEALRVAGGPGPTTITHNGVYGPTYGLSPQLPLLAPELELTSVMGAPESLDLTPLTNSAMIGSGLTSAVEDDFNGSSRNVQLPTLGALRTALNSTAPHPWALSQSRRPRLSELRPLHQAIEGQALGTATTATLSIHAPFPGAPYAVMPSLSANWVGGPLPHCPDAFTYLALNPLASDIFYAYTGFLDSAGEATVELRIPPLVIPLSLNLYHSAMIFDAQTSARLLTTNAARIVINL